MTAVSEAKQRPLSKISPRPVLAAGMLCWREIIRFFRQRNRVIGAIGTPLIFWLLFGTGLDRSFRLGDQGFREYFFPGTVVMILLFTSIFASISIIEDRREGFLQSVLVSPISRWSMVLGKVLGGSLIALIQGFVFSLLALALLESQTTLASWLAILLLLLIISVALTAMGYFLAWRMDSSQGFHAIMNLVLMPMWLLSGAFFPIPSSAENSLLHWVMRVNPLTYGVTGLRHLMFGDVGSQAAGMYWIPNLAACWVVTTLFAVVAILFAWKISGSRTTGDLL